MFVLNRTRMTEKGQRRRADKPRLQDTVRLSADGLAKVLGDLESRVMRAIWTIGRPAPARAVHNRIVRSHPVASWLDGPTRRSLAATIWVHSIWSPCTRSSHPRMVVFTYYLLAA